MAIVDSGEPLNDLDRTGHRHKLNPGPDGAFFDVTAQTDTGQRNRKRASPGRQAEGWAIVIVILAIPGRGCRVRRLHDGLWLSIPGRW